jgi:HEPN domain-containing protein
MPFDSKRIADTRAWLSKAAFDLRAAEYERGAPVSLAADIAFHAQQAVEKVLKAFLTWHDRPFRKTHNLIEIGGQCAALDPELEPLLRHVAPLTEYAWKFRYPGEEEEPTHDEAEEAFAMACEVYNAILDRLPKEVRP